METIRTYTVIVIDRTITTAITHKYTGADGLTNTKKTALPGALSQPTKRPPPLHARALKRCYAVLKAGSLALYATRGAPAPEAVLLFEAGTRVEVRG